MLEATELEDAELSLVELTATELAAAVRDALDTTVEGSSGEYVNIGGA